MRANVLRIALPAVLVAALVVAAVSQAAPSGDSFVGSWANVNACSSTQLGVRAQLAGDGEAGRMSARFSAEWLQDGAWVPLEGASTSPWQSAGSAAYTWQQVGWTFQLSAPQPGQAYQVRGVAELRWPDGRTETRVTGPCNVAG
jgi:hypothetical protein